MIAGQTAQKHLSLKGNLEADATAIRKVYVSAQNPEYGHLLRKFTQTRRPKAFIVHLRVVGICERGGRVCLAPLPLKPLPLHARPCIESKQELYDSGLWRNIATDQKSALFSDGCHSWKAMLEKAGLADQVLYRSCRHYIGEFVRKVPMPKSLSNMAGTMAIDSCWKHMKRYIGGDLSNKVQKKINPRFLMFMWGWAYRHNLKGRQPIFVRKSLGKACGKYFSKYGGVRGKRTRFPKLFW